MFKSFHLILLFTIFYAKGFFAQNDLLFQAQKLANENKFEEAIPVIDKVVLHPVTSKDPASWHIRAYTYLKLYKAKSSGGANKINLLDTVVFSAYKSLQIDKNTAYKENNEAFIKNIATTYYKLCVTYLQDSLENIKSEDFYLRYKKYTSFVNPTFDFKKKDIEYYNTKGSLFLDLAIKNDLNQKYIDISKSAILKVLEIDNQEVSANKNLAVLEYHKNQYLKHEIDGLLEEQKINLQKINASETLKKEFEIKALNKDKELKEIA